MTSSAVTIAGAVSYDYLIYPMTADIPVAVAERPQTDASLSSASLLHEEPTRLVVRAGAAELVAQLLTAAAPQWKLDVLGPGSHLADDNGRTAEASSLVELQLSTQTDQSAFRVVQRRQLAHRSLWHSPDAASVSERRNGVVVVCGSTEPVDASDPALDFLRNAEPRCIVHHMTRPLTMGPVWDLIRNGPVTADGTHNVDGLVVIVDADDLRAEGISLSQSLSWEATAEDFVRNLGSNGKLDTLVTCPNLIVRFGNEGIIYHRGRDATSPRLYFDPSQMECDIAVGQGQMIGMTSAFTAAFTLGFAGPTSSIDKGIRLGISAARAMRSKGFVLDTDNAPNYPLTSTTAAISEDKNFCSVTIPSAKISSGKRWDIFKTVTGDPAELARQIVVQGPEIALSRCPTQRFGDLLSVERHEQESLRAVVDSVHERIESSNSQPTSIGILGPSGSGKKFVALNLSRHFAADREVKQFTYDARLLRLEDLTSICHTIRDHTSGTSLTVVCFENFESVLSSRVPFLNDFLAIMRDGVFTDRGHVHNLGAPLLFFLINQGPSLPFGLHQAATSEHGESIGLDESIIMDYFHGVVRVAGPNQTASDDTMFSIRRALMLRRMLLQRFPRLEVGGIISIDEAVLHAILLVPSFKHGLRSLDKILSTSRLSSRSKFDVSALPPEEQIQLHVDGPKFMAFLRSPKLPPALREILAQGLFEAYKKKRRDIARTEAEIAALDNDHAMCDWDELLPELKESTRAQADDIPRKLRAVRCFMLKDLERDEPLVHVPEFSTEDLDILSEMEHERYNAERLQRQWHMGPRSASKRTTPFLVPWRDLTQDWKDVDRVMVECVPRVLAKAGWRIYRMREDA